MHHSALCSGAVGVQTLSDWGMQNGDKARKPLRCTNHVEWCTSTEDFRCLRKYCQVLWMRWIFAAERVNFLMKNLFFATNVILIRDSESDILSLYELGNRKQHGIKSLSSANTICSWILWSLGKHNEGVSICYRLAKTATLLTTITLEYQLGW